MQETDYALEEKRNDERRSRIITAVSTLVMCMLLTFVVTFIVMSIVNENRIDKIQKYYDDKIAEIYGDAEVFATLAELYSTLPEDEKNLKMYEKLACIDLYYRSSYPGEINEDELIYYMVNGYIAGIGDRYGEYYSVEGFDEHQGDLEGTGVGIGVYVNTDDTLSIIKILSVMEGSPAHKAGVKVGDVITHVDGKSVSEVGYYTAIDMIRGEEGSEVKLTVLRGENEIELTAVRQKFTAQTVYAHKYEFDEKIGVVRVLEFDSLTTAKQFKEAVNGLLEDGCTSLVFDMRGNPGGSLSSVVEILDFLLPKGDIVHITDGEGNEVDKYTSDASSVDVPMAVLTDGNSASAAELFTSALRDYDKAIIVGEKTYGKGSMQTIIPLYDGSALRFTSHLYNPPKSPNYNGVGISPDVEVKLSEELTNKNHFEITDSEDNVLRAAVDALSGK